MGVQEVRLVEFPDLDEKNNPRGSGLVPYFSPTSPSPTSTPP
ncbi:hypothetical protein [Actinomadura sp. 7K507]|nr:hypothetical protein [Actinomadura sp. 7K507]